MAIVMGTDFWFDNVSVLLLLKFVKIVKFTISWEWIKVIGLEVSRDTDDCLHFQVQMVILLWSDLLMKCCSFTWVSHGILLLEWNVVYEFDRTGTVRVVLVILTCDLMGVLFRIRYLILPLLGPYVCSRVLWCREISRVGYCDKTQSTRGNVVDYKWGFQFSFWTPASSSRRWVGRLTLTLQTLDAIHVGVDNFNVVKYAGRLLNATDEFRPAEFEHEEDPRILCGKWLIVSFLMSVSRWSGAASFF